MQQKSLSRKARVPSLLSKSASLAKRECLPCIYESGSLVIRKSLSCSEEPGSRDIEGRLSRGRRPALAGRSHRGNNCEEPGVIYKQRISRIKRMI